MGYFTPRLRARGRRTTRATSHRARAVSNTRRGSRCSLSIYIYYTPPEHAQEGNERTTTDHDQALRAKKWMRGMTAECPTHPSIHPSTPVVPASSAPGSVATVTHTKHTHTPRRCSRTRCPSPPRPPRRPWCPRRPRAAVKPSFVRTPRVVKKALARYVAVFAARASRARVARWDEDE